MKRKAGRLLYRDLEDFEIFNSHLLKMKWYRYPSSMSFIRYLKWPCRPLIHQ